MHASDPGTRMGLLLSAALISQAMSHPAIASNAAFQDFFFSACDNPSGALAARCAETDDGQGNISGDSETSLNPNQTLSSNQTPLGNARSQIARAEDRLADVAQAGEAAASIGPFSLLLNGGFTSIEQDATDNERGFDGDVYSIEVGLDKRVNDQLVLGGFLTYEKTDFDYDADGAGVNFTPQSNSGTTEADTYSVVIFGAYNFTEQWHFEGSVGASTSEYEFQRNVVFQESNRAIEQTNVQAQGDPDGDAYWFSGSVGYSFGSGSWSHTPYAMLSYVSSEIDGYTETDLNSSGLNMTIESDERESFTSTLGIRSSYAISTDWGVLVPQLHLAYEHEFDQDAQTSRSSFALDNNQNQYVIEGDDPDKDYFIAGVGAAAILQDGWMLFANVDGLLGHDERDRYQVTAGLRREF